MKTICLAASMIAVAAAGSGCGYTNTSTAAGGETPQSTPTSGSTTGTAGAATFTQVNQQILQPLCVSCHSPGSQTPNLSSYSSFATSTQYVVPGNASASLIYTVTANGQMPQGGPALSSAQLQLIASWINAGAQNN